VAGRQHPAIADVVRRRAEGELVNQMSRPHAPLHVGFEALRRPPGPAWRMRATALLTSAPDDVRRLLAMIDSEMPGLADWLDADAIAWWRNWLGSPRQSTETLALAPLGMIAVLLIVVVGNLPAWTGWLGAALSLALPVAAQRLVLQPQWRLQDSPWDAPEWLWWGWIPALLALFPVAGVLPEAGWSPAVLAALVVPVLGWLTVVTPLPGAPGLAARARAIFGTIWPFGVLGLTAARMLEPVAALLWMEVTLATALAWWRGSEAMAAPLRHRLGAWGLPVLVAIAAALVLGALVPRGDDAARWLLLAITAAMLALYLANRMLTPDRWRWLLLLGWGALAFGLLTEIGRQAPARPLVVSTRSVPTPPGAPPGGATARAIGDEQNWVRASDYPERAFPGPGTYKVAVNLAIGSEGKVILCTKADDTPARLADPTCAALRQRARFTPARDAKGKATPSLLVWRITWTVRGGATATRPPVAAPPPATPRPLRQVACPADTRSSAPGTALPPTPCDQPSWFQEGDYPEAAARAGQQGTVAWELAVDAAGGVTGCTVTAGSGSAVLDAETCRLLMGRARFLPARDGSGAPEPSSARGRMTWRLRP
jgi:TonB family protein